MLLGVGYALHTPFASRCLLTYVFLVPQHCQKMVPEYSKAALGLHPLVPVYAVNCHAEKNKRLCAEQVSHCEIFAPYQSSQWRRTRAYKASQLSNCSPVDYHNRLNCSMELRDPPVHSFTSRQEVFPSHMKRSTSKKISNRGLSRYVSCSAFPNLVLNQFFSASTNTSIAHCF